MVMPVQGSHWEDYLRRKVYPLRPCMHKFSNGPVWSMHTYVNIRERTSMVSFLYAIAASRAGCGDVKKERRVLVFMSSHIMQMRTVNLSQGSTGI